MKHVLDAVPHWVVSGDTQEEIIRKMFFQTLAVVAKYESDVVNPNVTFEEELKRLKKKYLNED